MADLRHDVTPVSSDVSTIPNYAGLKQDTDPIGSEGTFTATRGGIASTGDITSSTLTTGSMPETDTSEWSTIGNTVPGTLGTAQPRSTLADSIIGGTKAGATDAAKDLTKVGDMAHSMVEGAKEKLDVLRRS